MIIRPIPTAVLNHTCDIETVKYNGLGEKVGTSKTYKCKYENKRSILKNNSGIEIRSTGIAYINGEAIVKENDQITINSKEYVVKQVDFVYNPNATVHHTKIYLL